MGGTRTVPLPVHPAAELFPLMSAAELRELAEDIRQHGLHSPITMRRGQVLDGRNRLRACGIAGVPPRFDEYTGAEPVAFAVAQNLRRRHLTDDQRAAIAAEALPGLEAEARKRKGHGRTAPGRTLGADSPRASVSHPSRRSAAATFDVSTHAVRQAKQVREKAPDVHAQVKAGTVTAAEAGHEVAYRGAVERYAFLVDMPSEDTKQTAVQIAASLDSLREWPNFDERLAIAERNAVRMRTGQAAEDEAEYREQDRRRKEAERVRAAISVLALARMRVDPIVFLQSMAAPDVELEVLREQIAAARGYLDSIPIQRLEVVR